MDSNTTPSKSGDPLSTQQGLGKHMIVNGKITARSTNDDSNEGGSSQANKNSESEKRKKSNKRNATIPTNPIYPKDLDAWLENCMKDATAPQLSSSSEFLDYNPSSFNANKKPAQTPLTVNVNSFQKTVPEIPNFVNNAFNVNKLLKNPSGFEVDPSVDFASLPPTVNMGPGMDNNLDVNDPGRSFRFSDPCLIAQSDNDSKISGQNTPDPRNFENQVGNNKFLAALLEQLNLLRETNTKIYRNLHETKVEIEALKHASNWGLRHRRDSLSGLSTHSQPMGFAFGTHSPAPTYHSGMYTPGMMTDVIREVKEAARVREEALLNRVKAMVEERSWAIGEGNLRLIRDIEEMKAQIQHLRADRKEANKRITQLETENKYIRSILASILNNRTSEIIHENELFRSTPLRKNVHDLGRAKRSNFNLNYGTINHEEGFTMVNPNERNLQKSMSLDAMKLEQSHIDRRSSYLNSESHVTTQNGSYRPDNLYSTAVENEQTPNEGDHLLQMEKDTLDLRRELQEALASKKQAENRIIALENMVKRLQVKVPYHHPHSNDANSSAAISNGTTTSADISQSSERSTNLNQITSQMQGVSSKLSLAGPITDL